MSEALSKNKIRRLGDEIRSKNYIIDEETLKKLQEYRVSYKNTVTEMFNVLHVESKKISPDVIVTYRIKRIESILGKLKRLPNQEFDRMWDIAGCRCILKHENAVEKLYGKLKNIVTIKKINDYRSENNSDGYRSLHLYACLDNNTPIEVQLRTVKEHKWATFVEIIDFLYDKRIKEGEKDDEFIKFHFLLSKLNDLTLEEIVWILDFVEKHDIYNKLRSIFIKNYLEVRINWIKTKTKNKSLFYILEAQKDGLPVLTAFTNYNDAETEYFSKYLSGTKNNIVLIYVPFNNFDSLEKAYSNYLLTMHSFIDDYFLLLDKIILLNLKKIKRKEFSKYYKIMHTTLYCLIEDLRREIKSINEHSSIKEYKKEARNWNKEFRKRIGKTEKSIERINKTIAGNLPKNPIRKFLFNRAIKRINQESLKKSADSK